jgi:hypothetical protein
MGPKDVTDTKTNWPTDRSSQNRLDLTTKNTLLYDIVGHFGDKILLFFILILGNPELYYN